MMGLLDRFDGRRHGVPMALDNPNSGDSDFVRSRRAYPFGLVHGAAGCSSATAAAARTDWTML